MLDKIITIVASSMIDILLISVGILVVLPTDMQTRRLS